LSQIVYPAIGLKKYIIIIIIIIIIITIVAILYSVHDFTKQFGSCDKYRSALEILLWWSQVASLYHWQRIGIPANSIIYFKTRVNENMASQTLLG
jgi:hypothetical protein